jgi:hypothetical protein
VRKGIDRQGVCQFFLVAFCLPALGVWKRLPALTCGRCSADWEVFSDEGLAGMTWRREAVGKGDF